MASLDDAQAAYSTMSTAEKKLFLQANDLRLSQPVGLWLGIVWTIVLLVLAATIFYFGRMGYDQLQTGKGGAEVLFSFATAALGAVVGVLAPSPISRN